MSRSHPSTGDPFLDEALAEHDDGSAKNNVVVVCRVRPFNRREIEIQDEMNSAIHNDWEKKPLRSVVEMEGGDTVFLDHNNNYAERQRFPFDLSFWSIPPDQQKPGQNPVEGQVEMYRKVGIPIIKNIWSGFNSCVFAYGQTGSGKTFSQMGPPSDFGLIPRICQGLFASIEKRRQEDAIEEQEGRTDKSIIKEYSLSATFFEIYNDKVKDLLWALRIPSPDDANIDKDNIRVRHLGNEISLVGLTNLVVDNADDCLRLIDEGTKNRSVGATKMNDQSSRSHSIFRLTFTQLTRVLPKDKFDKPKVYTRVSTISLVDLAGSERMKKTGAEGQRLKEAVAINQSLTSLKNVIDALVEQRPVIPYRDSTLTWILSDNLGGNSKTFMIACVSPHFDNAEETLNTLRYALRTQAVVCHATVNESDELKRMNRMKEELERLQQQYADGAGDSEYVNLKSKQEELSRQATSTKEQADEAARNEIQTRKELEIAKRRRYNIAYRGAFHRVFQKRVDLAYTAYFARDAATLAGLKREVESYHHDSSSTDKELTDLRAEERRTASALRNSEAELARQRERMENTQASLRELDKTEARNSEEIILRQDKIPKSVHVSKQIVQRRLLTISVERERFVRLHTARLDKMKEEHSAEIELLRQERANKLEPLNAREAEIHETMVKEEKEHVTNMEELKKRLTQLQSSCVFVENENKRSASEVDEAILQGNKERFESFATTEAESKKKLQAFQAQSKASLAAELEAMRLNLFEGQSAHDRKIDRILEKTRDDVLRINRESEVRANNYHTELKARLNRFENLNVDAGQCLRSAKAAQKRYSDVFLRVMHVLTGAAPPEINTADEMDSVEDVIKKLQQTMGLAIFESSSNKNPHDISNGDPNAAYQHQSHSPLAFRTAGTSSSQKNNIANNNSSGNYSRSTSQTPSHPPSVTSSSRQHAHRASIFSNSGGISPGMVTPGRNVKFADPNNSNSKLRSPSNASSSRQQQQQPQSPLTFDPVAVLQKKAPPVYQTATSKLRQAYADRDKKVAEVRYQEASQEKPFTPRIHANSVASPTNNNNKNGKNATPSVNNRGRSPNATAAAAATPPSGNRASSSSQQRRSVKILGVSNKTSPQQQESAGGPFEQPWNNYENYYGYKSVATNEEPVLYSQRVVIEGSVIAMRTRTSDKNLNNNNKSPARRNNNNNSPPGGCVSSSGNRGGGRISPAPTTPRRY